MDWVEKFFEESTVDKSIYCVEGHDFTGKTSVCDFLKTEFEIIRLPGGTTFGENCRRLLKNREIARHPVADYFLLNAADTEFFWRVRPIWRYDKRFLLERGWLSRIIYQGRLGCVNMKQLITDLKYSWANTVPKKTVVLTCSEETLLQRMQGRAQDSWFDSRAKETRQHYKDFCEQYPQYVHEIPTDNLQPYEVAAKVKEYFLS